MALTDHPRQEPIAHDANDRLVRKRRRRWPWIVLGVVVVLVGAGTVLWQSASRAHQVSLQQAKRQAGALSGMAGSGRPAPGVYRYVGSGTEQLSLPPLSQTEGPTIPVTVRLEGSDCFIVRVDYSSHHWQTWEYCRHGTDLWELGGQQWQLWSIGPVNVTSSGTVTCTNTMALATHPSLGQVWSADCSGTNSAVSGTIFSRGTYRFLGDVTLRIGGTSVRCAHYLRLRTNSGAQQGTEHSDVWFDLANGLPVRMVQQLHATTQTSFGRTTYGQSGEFTAASVRPSA
jgi:hypothetical protein